MIMPMGLRMLPSSIDKALMRSVITCRRKRRQLANRDPVKVEDYVTIADAAKELGLAPLTLRKRCERGTVPTVSVFGARVIHRDTVAAMKKTKP